MAAGGVVALLDVVARIAAESGFDEATALSIYLPLTRQALANAESLGVAQALTGPFLRGDVGTVADHLDFLRRTAPESVPVYVALARRELDIARRRGALGDDQVERLKRLLVDGTETN